MLLRIICNRRKENFSKRQLSAEVGGWLGQAADRAAHRIVQALAGTASKYDFIFGKSGAPGGIRTPDPQIRSLVLYPAELPVRSAKAEPVLTVLAERLQACSRCRIEKSGRLKNLAIAWHGP